MPEVEIQISQANDIIPGLSIGFESAAYTVYEDSGSVEVCLRISGPLKTDSSVELSITLISRSATG